MKRILSLASLTALPGLALAHGDHGDSVMSSLAHIFSDAWHLLPILAVVLLLVVAKGPLTRQLSRAKRRKD